MSNVTLTIDGKNISAPAGTKLLRAALDSDIYIPNLCAIEDKPEPNAACRLCWVEVEGEKKPVTACTVAVRDGMVVNTKGEKALALARAGFDLLMASHRLDCAHCPANGKCELQKIAKILKCSLKPRNLRLILKDLPVDDSNPLFSYDPNKCVLCGRCVWECLKYKEKAMLGFAHRGFDRIVTTFWDEPIGDRCMKCGTCVKVCPTGALSFKESSKVKTQNSRP
jgi:formate dehydrogenase major subunit/NADH-quinone oxidoreductase subunit G